MDSFIVLLTTFFWVAGLYAVIFGIAWFIYLLRRKLIVFQGKVVAKQKMNHDGVIMPDSEVPTYKEENVRYQVTIEYSYYKTKKVESGHTGEINEVETSKKLKQSSLTCNNEVQFANYKMGETYWFVGNDKKDGYEVVV